MAFKIPVHFVSFPPALSHVSSKLLSFHVYHIFTLQVFPDKIQTVNLQKLNDFKGDFCFLYCVHSKLLFSCTKIGLNFTVQFILMLSD